MISSEINHIKGKWASNFLSRYDTLALSWFAFSAQFRDMPIIGSTIERGHCIPENVLNSLNLTPPLASKTAFRSQDAFHWGWFRAPCTYGIRMSYLGLFCLLSVLRACLLCSVQYAESFCNNNMVDVWSIDFVYVQWTASRRYRTNRKEVALKTNEWITLMCCWLQKNCSTLNEIKEKISWRLYIILW